MPEPGREAVTIREAREADLPVLVRLLAQLSLDEPREQPGPPLPEAYEQAFGKIEADPGLRLLVACREERIVGSATVAVIPNLSFRGRPFTLVDSVVVDESERRSGVGRLLMEEARRIARASGSYKLSLTSNAQRDWAHRFYERLGFRETHKGYTVEP